MDPRLDSEEERGGIVALPAFQVGGRVERTGLALVHEGEYIVPAEGSGAIVAAGRRPVEQTVTYHFPVSVEVMGELTDEHMRAVADFVFDELDSALDRRSDA